MGAAKRGRFLMSVDFSVKTDSPHELYSSLRQVIASLLEGETDAIANLANVSSLLFHSLPHVNWVGFYVLKGQELVLGPFQGKVACTRIPLGRGVCGTSAAQRTTLLVEDVELFPGHIACDSASRSEVVVPFLVEGQLLGVLDVDSPLRARFTQEDARGLESLVQELATRVRIWQPLLP